MSAREHDPIDRSCGICGLPREGHGKRQTAPLELHSWEPIYFERHKRGCAAAGMARPSHLCCGGWVPHLDDCPAETTGYCICDRLAAARDEGARLVLNELTRAEFTTAADHAAQQRQYALGSALFDWPTDGSEPTLRKPADGAE